jgi:hypothetical protein
MAGITLSEGAVLAIILGIESAIRASVNRIVEMENDEVQINAFIATKEVEVADHKQWLRDRIAKALAEDTQ